MTGGHCCRLRPPGGTDEEGSDWFSIFVLHQNRVEHGHGQKNAIKPEYLARFLDLVIWGHEHECIPDPWVSLCCCGEHECIQDSLVLTAAAAVSASAPRSPG